MNIISYSLTVDGVVVILRGWEHLGSHPIIEVVFFALKKLYFLHSRSCTFCTQEVVLFALTHGGDTKTLFLHHPVPSYHVLIFTHLNPTCHLVILLVILRGVENTLIIHAIIKPVLHHLMPLHSCERIQLWAQEHRVQNGKTVGKGARRQGCKRAREMEECDRVPYKGTQGYKMVKLARG